MNLRDGLTDNCQGPRLSAWIFLAALGLAVIWTGIRAVETWRWLETGWAPINPECAYREGPGMLEGPMIPVFANNYEAWLRYRYGDAAVGRTSPTAIEVRAPIAAFDDGSAQATPRHRSPDFWRSG